ncbi:molybdopterin-binding protein [Streptomyces chartreusis]|uniref:molybdopterin-binding protein n=1 Tax=Streptomyces chartreusis TaxID=1969 RepID=UPI003638EAE6
MPIDDSPPSPLPVRIAVLKVLDNRTRTDDAAGDLLVSRIVEAGHLLAARDRVAADLPSIVDVLMAWTKDPDIDCVITVGGTGFSPRDVTPEALAQVWDREIAGFGELFRMVSYRSVGSSAIQSRACAGLAGRVCLFAVPGSPGGVRDAWDSLIGPQLDSLHKPCNLVEHLNCACRT